MKSAIPSKPGQPSPAIGTRRLILQFAYLSQRNPLWLFNLPGVDNLAVREARRRQLAGEQWDWYALVKNVLS